MICELTIPSSSHSPLFLAGGGLVSSETSGLSISSSGSPQVVNYIGSREGRQFFRGGSLTTASFNSSREFTTIDLATQFIIDLQSALADAYSQQNTAKIAKRINKVTVGESVTLSPDGKGVLQETGTGTHIYDTYEIAETYPRKRLYLDGATAKLEYYANAGEFTGTPSGLWTSTTVAGSADATDPAVYTSWTASTGSGVPTFATAATDNPVITLYDCAPSVSASRIGVSVNLSVSLIGRLASP
tara:strand:- start:28 stop:759 length:732 start_codon:yes stop_codon:yes gene_type:complete